MMMSLRMETARFPKDLANRSSRRRNWHLMQFLFAEELTMVCLAPLQPMESRYVLGGQSLFAPQHCGVLLTSTVP